jgi:ParB-like chromosome segregation protein Spo0J
MKLVKITDVKPNPKNPRIIKDGKFQKLVKSIQEFPDMLNKRPLIVFTDVDNKYCVLGGNMRLKALNELKFKEIPVIIADEWTEEQKAEFLIKDNVGFGEWDWDSLANEWGVEKLEDWGLNVPEFSNEVDYSILDDEDLADDLLDMANGVKKAIQIEFEAEHYESAYELVKFWREREAYVGGMIMEYLKAEKEKL